MSEKLSLSLLLPPEAEGVGLGPSRHRGSLKSSLRGSDNSRGVGVTGGHRGSLKSSLRGSDNSRSSDYHLLAPVASLRNWIGTPQDVTEHKNGSTTKNNLFWEEQSAKVVLCPLDGGAPLEITGQDMSEMLLYHEIPDFAKVFPGVYDPRRCLKLKMGRSAAVHLEFASEMAVLKWVNGISDVMSELLNTALVAVDGAASHLSTKDKAEVRQHLLAGAIVSRYSLEGTKRGAVFLEEPPPGSAAPVGEDEPPMGRLCFCDNVHLRQVSESWDFADICDIYVGKQVAELQTPAAETAPPTCCMSVVTEAEDGTPSGIHMEFKTAETLQTFLKAIADVLNGGGATIVEGQKEAEGDEEEAVRRQSLLSPRFCDPLKERRLTLTSSYLQDMERGIQVQVLTDAGVAPDESRFVNARMVLDHSEHASRIQVQREDCTLMLCIVANNLRAVKTAEDVTLPETINGVPAMMAVEDVHSMASFATKSEDITVKFSSRHEVETWLSALSDVIRNGPQLVELTRSCGILLEGQDVHRHTNEGRQAVFLFFEDSLVGEEASMGRLCVSQRGSHEKDFVLEVKDVSDIFVGKQASEFQSPAAGAIDEACCMSFVGELLVTQEASSEPPAPSFITSTLNVEFPSAQLLQAWLRAVTNVLNGGGATIVAGDAHANQKMAEVGVGGQDGSTRPLQQRASTAACSLSIRSPTGATIVIVDAQNNDTIAIIKEKVKELLFIEVAQQRLLYAGMDLQNDRTLEWYQIPPVERSIVLLTAPEKPFEPKPINLNNGVDVTDLKLTVKLDEAEEDKSEMQKFLPKRISEQRREEYDDNELKKQQAACCFCS